MRNAVLTRSGSIFFKNVNVIKEKKAENVVKIRGG